MLGVTAHVNLKPIGPQGIRNYRELMAQLSSTPGVRSIEPAVYNTVLLSSGGRARGLVLKGVDPELELRASEALRHIVSGSDSFAADADGIPALARGAAARGRFWNFRGRLRDADEPAGKSDALRDAPAVAAISSHGNFRFRILRLRRELGIRDAALGANARRNRRRGQPARNSRDNLDDAGRVASDLLSRAAKGFTVTTWMDENRALFRALSLEKLVTALFIGLITFVAGLNILVVLTMTVADRARDIAVLMAMGARRAQVRNIFILQGLAVSVAGTAAGLLFGYAFAWVANRGN